MALPAPDWAYRETETTFAKLQTDMESLIAEVWEDALGLDRIGLCGNLFNLGGHSLQAMQAIAKLEKATGLGLELREFVYRTLTQVASVYEE